MEKKEEKNYITLVEKHDVLKGTELFDTLDHISFLAKNLYNAGLYAVRQHFFKTGKFLSYTELQENFQNGKNPDYYALPTKVSQQVLRLVCKNFKSFFELLKKKKKGEYDKPVHIPHYLPKTRGRQVVEYTNQAVSTAKRKGYINPSGTDVFIKTKVSEVQFVRVVHKKYKIVVEIGYRQEIDKTACSNLETKFAAIDLGVSNLATVSFTDEAPFIVNGKPLKSINQFFNKRNAELVSIREKHDPNDHQRTPKMERLSRIRENRISDYLHKSSRYIVSELQKRKVTCLIIGYNPEWKQESNLGKKTNQNFVGIPFYTFIHQLQYKCLIAGIEVILVDESYTSKASFTKRDEIPTYYEGFDRDYEFSGYRKGRGLYKVKGSDIILNADLNGSLNIMRKFFQENPDKEVPFVDKICTSNPVTHTIGNWVGKRIHKKRKGRGRIKHKNQKKPA